MTGLDYRLDWSGLDPNDAIFIPQVSSSDKLWNYEVGMNMSWDGVSANLSIYKMVWDDIQLSAQRGGGYSTQFMTNVAEVEFEGVEVEILSYIGGNLEVGRNVAIQDAKITQLTDRAAIMVGV